MTNSEARKRAQEAASVEISGAGAPNSPNEGPSGSGSENGAQGNSQDSAPTHVVLSRENGAQHPVDSGAIGRLNEAERDRLAAALRQPGLIALDPTALYAEVAAILREHTDRALAEVEQRIEALASANDIQLARSGASAYTGIGSEELRAIVRAARQEQGR